MLTELYFQALAGGALEYTGLRLQTPKIRAWSEREKLKLFLIGYNGFRNTGADARVSEMIRQFQQVLGADNLDLSILVGPDEKALDYFHGARRVPLGAQYGLAFHQHLVKEIGMSHGAVACEGATFKSSFTNAMTERMIAALGIANAQDKISIAYGSDADDLKWSVKQLCSRYCKGTLVVARSSESKALLENLGLIVKEGTDTAWTFESELPEFGGEALRSQGWDGIKPVLVVCPTDPFRLPLLRSAAKYMLRSVSNAYRSAHVSGLLFKRSGKKVDAARALYVEKMAAGIERFTGQRNIFVVIVGMGAVDAQVCDELSARLGRAPVFTSVTHGIHEIVSLLRSAQYLVASRYHAVVLSMPRAVPTVAVAWDRRLRDLYSNRDASNLVVRATDPDLADKIEGALLEIEQNRSAIRADIEVETVKHLRKLAEMGVQLEAEIKRRYPRFTLSHKNSLMDYLPPLSEYVRDLISRYPAAF